MATASIDNLAPTRSLIDLSDPDKGDFGIDDYELSFIFDDILLIEYVDETQEGEIERNGILIPTNALNKAWRKGRVILAGPDAKYAKEGDIVIFPSKTIHSTQPNASNKERISISADISLIAKDSKLLEHLTPPISNWQKM